MSTPSGNFSAPANEAVAVTPSDTVNITGISAVRGLYIGVGGNVSVQMQNGQNTVMFIGVPTGAILPVCVTRVNATTGGATTATNIVALG